jgi:hypothetical protein
MRKNSPLKCILGKRGKKKKQNSTSHGFAKKFEIIMFSGILVI